MMWISPVERGQFKSTGRRLALARWLTENGHPLTARVMVNRLWHHHFGRGIVGTPNDFGRNGEQPTHTELLDWLATELMNPSSQFTDHSSQREPRTANWSLKHIHKLIVLSNTYRQTSATDTVKEKLDQAKAEAEAKAKAEADRLKKEAENKAKDEVNKLKKKFRF